MSEVKKDAPAVKEGEGNTEKPKVETIEESINEKSKEDSEKDKQIASDQRKRAEKAELEADKLRAEITKLKTDAVSGGKSVGEVNDELKRLATEHNIDEGFLTKLVSTVRTATTKEIREELEKDYSPKLAKIEQERNQDKMNEKFSELYSKVLKDYPEYDGVANKEVIKALTFNPANAKKTLPQILEEVYGAAIVGKKSIETSRGSREPEAPNYESPSKEDWERINSDPKAKEEWAKKTEAQIKQYM